MIKPTKTLPDGYIDYFSFDLSKNTRLIIVLNIVSLGLFFLFGWIFLRLIQILRPAFTLSGEIKGNLAWALWIIVSYLFVVVLHELIHIIESGCPGITARSLAR